LTNLMGLIEKEMDANKKGKLLVSFFEKFLYADLTEKERKKLRKRLIKETKKALK